MKYVCEKYNISPFKVLKYIFDFITTNESTNVKNALSI